MNNSYIPTILKDKLALFINYFFGVLFLFIGLFTVLSLYSFEIFDNSFLTSSSQPSTNFFGNFGSFIASFIFYSFGILGYGVGIFFSYSISIF